MSTLEKAISSYSATKGHNTRISKDVSWLYARRKSLLRSGKPKQAAALKAAGRTEQSKHN